MKHFVKSAIALFLVLVFMVGLVPVSAFASEPADAEAHLEHNWSDWKVTVEPSCTAKGSRTKTCEVCGETVTEELPALDHSWGEWKDVTEPDCVNAGSRTHVCTVCGETVTEVLPALGHSWGEWKDVTEPDCVNAGSHTHVCTVCGETVTEAIPALGHSWGEWQDVTEPDCVNAGSHTHVCTVCGETATEAIPALGHSWGEWVESVNPTCTGEGEHTHVCTVCGESATEAIPALGHSWGEWVETLKPTCTKEGAHEHVCAVCGEKETGKIPAVGHTWSEDNGHDVVKCTVCGVWKLIAEGGSFDLRFDGDQWIVAGDPCADVEDPSSWSGLFAGVAFTGNWAEDLVAAALSQIGYHESSANFAISKHEQRNGYTRYGAWYSIPYGDWCAMFVSFCMNYAGISRFSIPYDSGCASWANNLSACGLYGTPDSYSPKAGDLIFFYGDSGAISHVGIVHWVDENVGVIHTIEGNLNDQVATREVSRYDGSIAGYGIMPENPALSAPAEIERGQKSISAVAGGRTITVSGLLPADAELSVVAVPLDTAAEILSAQKGEAVEAEEMAFAFDVSILSGGGKYDLETYGDSVTVSISDVIAEDLTVTHVKIDVTDGNGGLDQAALNDAKTEKIESETMDVKPEDGTVFFDLTSCSFVAAQYKLGGAAKAANAPVSVTINWKDDDMIPESLVNRPSSVSFSVESTTDGTTWTPVDGSFSVSGGTDSNTWSSNWQLPAEDEEGNPLTYRFTEQTTGWIEGTERYNHDRYTVTGAQTTGSSNNLTFNNEYNWPWPLVDKGDALYDGDDAIDKLFASADGPSLTEGGPEASGPFVAGQELYYKIHFNLATAESWTRPGPYNSSSPLYDEYSNVQLKLTLPAGILLEDAGGKNFTTDPAGTDVSVAHTYTIDIGDTFNALNGSSGNFNIKVYIGNNGTEQSVHPDTNPYSLADSIKISAKWELVDRTHLTNDPAYHTGAWYEQEFVASANNITTTTPDVWGVQKSLVGDGGDVDQINKKVTFIWKVDVGLKDGQNLITNVSEYRRDGADAVTIDLTETVSAQFVPAEGTASDLTPSSFKIIKGSLSENEEDWTTCPAGTAVQVWPASTDPNLSGLVMNSGLVLDKNGDGTNDTETPRYTTYYVKAVYDITDGMIGDFTAAVNKIDASNTAATHAVLANVSEPQNESKTVPATAPLFLNEPAKVKIFKYLTTIKDGSESQILYSGDNEKYGPLNYELTDANGNAVDIYTIENNAYVKVDTATTPLVTEKLYYVVPGFAYKVKETIPSNHTNDMTPVDGVDSTTSDHTLAAGELWEAKLYNKETRGEIIIIKTDDKDPPKRLNGATFKVESEDGTITQTATIGSSDNGKLIFSDLPYGKYTVTEVTPPPGYVALPDQFPDEVEIGETGGLQRSVEVTYQNTETKATIALTKHVGTTEDTISTSWPKATTTDAGYFTFVLQRTTKENPDEGDWETAKDINNQPVTVTLTNGEFSVQVPAVEGNDTYKYRFKETISPNSSGVYLYYVADKPDVYTAATDPVTLTPGSTDTMVHMYNRKLARVLISKNFYDVNTNGGFTNQSNSTLTAKFQVYSYKGTGTPTAAQLLPVGDPKSVGRSNVEWAELELYDDGTPVQYFIKETEPTEGFVWNLTENGAATKTGAPDGYMRLDPTKLANNLTWTTVQRNYRYAFPIRFAKKNFYTGRSDISGVKVTIYSNAACTEIARDVNGNELKDIELPVANNNQTLRYTAFKWLKPGQLYYYKETVPANYSFVEATSDGSTTPPANGGVIDLTGLTPPYSGTTNKAYVVTNKPDPQITINKRSATSRNTAVSGAEFTVYVKNTATGAYVTYPIGAETPMVITTTNAASGKYLPATLPEGYEGYYFTESKTPDNYLNPNSEGACAVYNELDPPESGQAQDNKYIWDSATGKTFVKGEVTDAQNATFTFYNVPNTGNVKVVKLVDGNPATEAGFPVEIQDANGQVVKSGSTTVSGSGTSLVNSVTLSGIKIYNDDGTKIQYTVKEGALTGTKADTYYLVSDGQTFKLEPGQTVSVDDTTEGKTLTINNATYIKVTGTKFKLDTWQYAHGGFTETMSGVTVGLYRRAIKSDGTPYGDGTWQPTGQTMTTGSDGIVSFDKLIRGEKLEDTEVSYEYALVELSSTDPNYFPMINGKVKEDGFPPSSTAALSDGDLFGENAKYNALPLRVDNIVSVGSTNDYTSDGKLYKLGDMLNGNHWVQFDITKWLDAHTLTYNLENGVTPIDSEGHRTAASTVPGPGDTTLNDCVYSLYRCILNEGQNMVAFTRTDPWVCLGTYTSGTLFDAAGETIDGRFRTLIDTNVNSNYVYVLVEESTGPTGAIPNPYFRYTVYTGKPGVTVTGLPNARTGSYDLDTVTFDNLLNSKEESEGDGEIFLTSFRLAKWRDSYDAQGNRMQVYEPLSNAKFRLFVTDLRDNQVKEISHLISGLDGGSNYAMAQSGTFQLAQNPKIGDETLSGVYIVEYEVEGGTPKYYKVGETLDNLLLNNPSGNGYAVYGVPVELREYGAPAGYGFSPRTYPTYLIFVDITPGQPGTGTYRTISDLYFVKDTEKPPTTPLAEGQDNDHHWHVTCDDDNGWDAFGDSPLLRIVDYPMNNIPVEVIKVGYEVNAATLQKDATTIATGNYGAEPLEGVTMVLQREDPESTATDKFRPWDYNADNWGDAGEEITFVTDELGSFFFPKGLPMGTYRIYEKSLGTDNGSYENAYDKAGEFYRIFVVGGEPEVIYMANPKKMQLSLVKKDMVTGEELDGWTFKLGTKTAANDTANHVYTFTDIATGSYALTETAPDGSEYSTTYFSDWFKKNCASMLDASGKLIVGYTFLSIDYDDGKDVYVNTVAPWDSSENKIPQLEIENPPLTDFTVKKTDLTTGTQVNGANFELFYMPFKDASGKVVSSGDITVTLPTIADGTAIANVKTAFTNAGWTDKGNFSFGSKLFENQEPGIYVVYENSPPMGWGRLLDGSNVVLYSAVLTGGLDVNVTVSPSKVTVGGQEITTNFTSTDGAAVTVTAKDPKKAPLKAQKVPLYGELEAADIGNWSVTLDIYDAPTGGTKVGTVTIEKGTDGEVNFKNPTSLTNNAFFNMGQDYYLEETVNVTDATYADADHFQLVSVILLKDDNGQVVEVPASLAPNSDRYKITVDDVNGFTIKVSNQYLYGYVNFWKLDDDLNERPGLTGAQFEVRLDPDDETSVVPGSSVEEIKVNGQGTGKYRAYIPLESANLTTYYIFETDPPENYVIDKDHGSLVVALSAEDNVKDFTVTPDPSDPSYPYFQQDGKPKEGEYHYYIPNTKGCTLTVLKYKDVHGVTPEETAGARDATFTVYHKTGTDPVTGEDTWEIVDRFETDSDGTITYLMTPYETYAVGETDFDPSKFNGLEGIYVNNVKQTLVEITDPGTNEKVWVVKGIKGESTITLKAYNNPIYNPTIVKIDVGQYPEGVVPIMDFEVYEVDASFVATPDTVKALVKDADKVPVFSGRTGGTHNVTEGEGEDAVTYLGTEKVWTGEVPEKRWDHTKYYVLVETEVGATANPDYNTMVKDDPRVVWYLPIAPISDPSTGLEPWILRNINGVADVELTKTAVEHEVDETSDVVDGKVESLLEDKRTVVYTVEPVVSGSNQKLQSFVLEDFGLTSKPEGATFDYKITTLEVGGATHRTGEAITAKVTFDNQTAPVEVTVPADVNDSASVTVPEGAKSFTVEYYSADVMTATNYSETPSTDPETGDPTTTIKGYKLGEEFRVGTTTFTVVVAKTPEASAANPAKEITEFTNSAKVTLSYPIWTSKGEGPTYDPKTDEDDATVLVKKLQLPIVSITKTHTGIDPGNPVQTGSILNYQVEIENTDATEADFINPVVLDILPTGVTFFRSEEKPVTLDTDSEDLKIVGIVSKTGEATQMITITTESGTTEQVYGDAETAVIFKMTGTLQPGQKATISFYVKVGSSAVLYETADGTFIENEAYLSSSKHTYHTEDNIYGYSFLAGDDTPGDDLVTAAANANNGVTGDPAELHEQGVHDYLGKDDSQQDYVDPEDYVWIVSQDKLSVVRGSNLTLSKGVRGDQDDGFLDGGLGTATRTVTPATPTHNEHVGWVDWRLTVNNGYDYPARKLMVGDVIPKVGDTTNSRSSQWDVVFDSLDVVKANGVVLTYGTDYEFYYYMGAIGDAQSALDEALLANTGLRVGPVDGWTAGIPGVDVNKENITAIALVFNQADDDPTTEDVVEGVELNPGSSLIVTYHTLVKNYPDDDDFNKNRAYQNADNVFYVASDEPRPLSSNVVSVTLLDGLVSVEGDVWIDEDWDGLQQSTGNRRDYSQYAIVQALANNISFSIVDGREVANEASYDEDSNHGENTNPGYGESVRHFTFSDRGPALYVPGRTLYGPNDYLNAGIYKIDAQGALKGSDPFFYWLNATLGSGAPLNSIDLSELGKNHYKSDDPDTELTATALQSLDNNFYPASGKSRAITSTNFTTHPFYLRYADYVDQSKDFGVRYSRDLIILKQTDDENPAPLAKVEFKIYGPYEDTTIKDPETDELFPARTPAYGYSGDGLLKFSKTTVDGKVVYVLDPDGEETVLVTDKDGQIHVSGLNWWKEYEIKETKPAPGYIVDNATAEGDSNTEIIDQGGGVFTLMVPGTQRLEEPDRVTVTNPLEVVNISGIKDWADAEDDDEIRPDSVTVILSADDGSADRTTEATAASNWAWSFTNLPKYKIEVAEDGTVTATEITYTVDESAIPEYEKTIVKNDDGTYTITNTHNPEKVNASVVKVWDDNENQDNLRPATLTVELKKLSGTSLVSLDPVQTKTLTKDDGWAQQTITNLPKYDFTITEENGVRVVTKTEITYRWVEVNLPSDYSLSDSTESVEGATITTTLTNYHELNKVAVHVEKIWNDSQDADEIQPPSIQVQLMYKTATMESAAPVTIDGVTNPVTLDASNEWKYTWEELDENSGGQPIEYTVDEVSIPYDYEKVVEGDATTGFIITNSHTPERIVKNGIKEWVDDDNDQETRPDSVTVILSADDGSADRTTEATAASNWAWSFTDLPKYEYIFDEDTGLAVNKREIVYTVDESAVPKYTTTIVENDDGTYTITNTLEPGDLEITKLISESSIAAVESAGLEDTEFTVKLTLTKPGEPAINGSFDAVVTRNGSTRTETVSFTNGVATFAIKGDETWLIQALPFGAVYTVEEADPGECWNLAESTNLTGKIMGASKVSVSLTNEFVPGSLMIMKTVTGSRGDKDKQFVFKIELGASGSYPYTIFDSDDSVLDEGFIKSGGKIKLKHGQYAIITGLPAGSSYKVTETKPNGYRVSSTGSVGNISANRTKTVSFINYKGHTPPTGENNLLPVTVPAMLLSGLAMILTLFSGRKRREKKTK